MKIFDLYRRLDEAPIGDYELVGNWGDKEKSHGFRHAADRKMLQNPTAVRIARKKFGNTEHNLNFYFVNLPGASKYAEYGVMTPEKIAEVMPKAWPQIAARAEEADHENAINVIFVGNTGFQRMNMTPWIMAHRIGHALQSAERGMYGRGAGAWKEYEEDAAEFFTNILAQVYNWELYHRRGAGSFWFSTDNRQDKLLAKFFEGIGGMRSARKGQLGGRPYEFLYEMFAQHVTTGRLTFRSLPQSFGVRGGRQYRIYDEVAAEMWNRDLNNGVGDHLSSRIDNTLYYTTGKFLIM